LQNVGTAVNAFDRYTKAFSRYSAWLSKKLALFIELCSKHTVVLTHELVASIGVAIAGSSPGQSRS
jgi:hypothetical protein